MPKAQMSITSTMCLILTCEPTAARIGRAPKAFGKSAVFRLLIFRMERLRGTLDSLVFACKKPPDEYNFSGVLFLWKTK